MKQEIERIATSYEEDSEFDINTCNICRDELLFFNDPEYRPWRKVPQSIIYELERTIQRAMLRSLEPTVNHSENDRDYMKARFDMQFDNNFENPIPFHHGYFVVTYSAPLKQDKKQRAISFAGRDYMYLFSYDASLKIHRGMIADKTISNEEFDMLFAFAIRECDMMKVPSFLNHHLEKTFLGDLKEFHPYLTLLTRKFSPTIFTDPLTLTIEEWLNHHKTNLTRQNTKRVKTNLSVDKISYLFRTLVDSSLISDENKADVVRMITDSFQSKMREELSRKSVEDKFFNPTDDAMQFWKDQFARLSAKAEKDFEKNRK